MADLLRAEWLKQTRRPLARLLLGIVLVILALQLLLQGTLSALLGAQLTSSGAQGILAEFGRGTNFPGIFGTVLGFVNGIGGFFAIVYAAAALGSEYAWGTLRAQLARHPQRARFLIAKALVVLALLAVAILLALLVGSVVALLVSGLSGTLVLPGAADLLALPAAVARAWLVLVPYTLLTLLWVVIGRSALAGVAGGFIYLFAEAGLGYAVLFTELLGDGWRGFYNLTIGQNINALTIANNQAFGLNTAIVTGFDPSSLPPVPQAVGVIMLYGITFFASAVWLFGRRDISGAG